MTPEEVRDSLLRSNELVAIAVLNGNTVGYACAQYFESFCYHEKHGYLTEMFIEESARGRGLATMLMAHIEDELRTRGVSEVSVLTGADNEIAIKAYERFQYVRQADAVLQKTLPGKSSKPSE
ncbi:GNAT family N-acetyltransferase (plasmid) [Paenibacillus cellulosilyticus]|nr:GNAT family N-acetyltransferase [Paenibacillus cellulosilyticus]